MNILRKKIMIYSLVGIMQVGIGASIGANVIEASPLHTDGTPQIVQLDRHDGNDRREERRHQENRRHQREMQRRHHESDRDWNDRQWRENQRHDNTMNEIAAGIIGIIIGSAIN